MRITEKIRLDMQGLVENGRITIVKSIMKLFTGTD